MLLTVRVHPSASREAVEPRAAGAVEVWVRKPPAEGQANRAVLELLADRLHLPRTAVRLARGASGRVKTIELPLERWEQVVERLATR